MICQCLKPQRVFKVIPTVAKEVPLDPLLHWSKFYYIIPQQPHTHVLHVFCAEKKMKYMILITEI